MAALVIEKLKSLAWVLADLRDRVRAVLASEVARAVGDAAREVVQTVLAGSASGSVTPDVRGLDGHRSDDPWDADHPDPWDDDPWEPDRDEVEEPPAGLMVPETDSEPTSSPGPALAGAVSAGAAAARWWLARGGGIVAAAGVGLAVLLAGLVGGPAARGGLTLLAAAADLASVTDALDSGAARLAAV